MSAVASAMSQSKHPTTLSSDLLPRDASIFTISEEPQAGQSTVSKSRASGSDSNPDLLLASFYYNAFAAHPFVLPQSHISRIEADSMQVVIAAMRWVGSLYLDTHLRARDELFHEARRIVYNPSTPRDGFLVQAMMLLLVALDGCSQQRIAVQMLGDAERLALEIGLNTRAFVSLHGRGIPILEESWRRTWWDLYMTDGMIAGVHRATSFALFDAVTDVQLPCEEHQYLSGVSLLDGHYVCLF